jgi:hypothetical protein
MEDMMYDANETLDNNRSSLSINQFCRRAKELLGLDQPDFVRFILTGRDSDGSQACVDPIFNFVEPEDPITVRRDYDSLLGICESIMVDDSLTVFPVSKNEDTLS